MNVLCDACCRITSSCDFSSYMVLARRRGFGGVGSLINGLMNGEGTSWLILGGVVSAGALWYVIKSHFDD